MDIFFDPPDPTTGTGGGFTKPWLGESNNSIELI
jgi:hypothetical protein